MMSTMHPGLKEGKQVFLLYGHDYYIQLFIISEKKRHIHKYVVINTSEPPPSYT